jgi:hypothetical protein
MALPVLKLQEYDYMNEVSRDVTVLINYLCNNALSTELAIQRRWYGDL